MGIFVITGPSAVGKTTITESLISTNKNVTKVITHTTRTPRTGERHGKHYKFITKKEFQNKIENNEMFEHAEVYGHLYGSTKSDVFSLLDSGKHIIFPIDVQGALTIKKEFPSSIVIFLEPLDLQQLKERMIERGDSKEVIEKRMKEYQNEFSLSRSFDFIIKNNVLSDTISTAKEIIKNSK